MQVAIDFTIPFNQHKGNQIILEENREHFGGQTKWVFEELMSGNHVWGVAAFELKRIQDLRARIFTIKKKGFEFSEGKVQGGKGSKYWFMTAEQIAYNGYLLCVC